MFSVRLFSGANGSKGAQCRRKTVRADEAGRPLRMYALSASATSGNRGSARGLPVLSCRRSMRPPRQSMSSSVSCRISQGRKP